MDKLEIRKIDSKKDVNRFIKFAWEIYKGYENWVPPLLMDIKKVLNVKKNPFYQHAQMQLFLAEREGKIVGRIAAIVNENHLKEHNDGVGFFGFFESIDDQNVADALFKSAGEWLKEKGIKYMRGPANPSVNDIYGMLLEGFDDPPRLLMPYNPKYYLTLCDNFGFRKEKDLYAYSITNEDLMKSDKVVRISQIAAKRAGLTIRPMNMKRFKEDVEEIKFVYNRAWANNWGAVAMTEAEMDALAADLKPLVDPSLALFAEINGKTVGFALVMPDYNHVFKEMNGRLFPFGFLKLLTKSKTIPWARIIILGIIPEYQKRGLDAPMYLEVAKQAAKRGILKGEASWILEDNEMMNRGAKMMNGEIYKKYRIYQKEL